ncbi:hypothetical protein THAOC_15249 [Thalassiosira oceanica]|uniref:Uncharacterized protein n=1 Tax=Thalassiosira oceanica TaxID=159749 RepID=K0SSR4_THAOC|nr:hypothetical protein THAOC_15249 [Thalassiosira oceanica]|eukprot:EJK64056.1 hypothetical protein THAOC_15249 [Thalassiosira oceanica]
MRCRNQNSNAQVGWSLSSEHLLKKLAVEHDYDWNKVALQMKNELGGNFGDEDVCERRHALLSLGTNEMKTPAEDSESGAFQFPPTTTTKPLSAFLNEGARKSFTEILEAGDGLLDGRKETRRPLSLPTSNADSEDDDITL